MTTLGSLAKAGALTFGDGYRTRGDQLAETGFRILRAGDIQEGAYVLESPDFVISHMSGAIGNKVVREGDVVLTTKGTVGRTAFITSIGEPAVYSPQLCFFRPDPDVIEPRFLYYWFSSREFTQQSSSLKSSTDMAPYISLSQLAGVNINLAPLSEQRAIAEVLGALDDKIAANSGLVTQATDLAQAITRRAIEGGDLVSLSSLASITMGSSPKGTSYNETGEGAVLYQGMRDFGTRFPTPRVWTTDPVRTAGMNDVLVSVRAPVGTLNRASEPCCIGRGLAALETSHHAALYHLLLAQQENFSPFNSDGTIFGSISKPQLSNLPVKVPRGGLSELDAVVAPVEDVVGSAIQESTTLAQLRDTLLPALMDGTLRVKDAILHAEEVL